MKIIIAVLCMMTNLKSIKPQKIFTLSTRRVIEAKPQYFQPYFQVIWHTVLPDNGFCEDVEWIEYNGQYYAFLTSDNNYIYGYHISPEGGSNTPEYVGSDNDPFNSEDADYEPIYDYYMVGDSTGEILVYQVTSGKIGLSLIWSFLTFSGIRDVVKRGLTKALDAIIGESQKWIKANIQNTTWQSILIEGVGLLHGLLSKFISSLKNSGNISEWVYFGSDSGLVIVDTAATTAVVYQAGAPIYSGVVGSPDGVDIYAFTAAANGYVDAWKITDPFNGYYLWSFQMPTWAVEMDYDGEYLSISDGYYGTYIIDVSDIYNPQYIGNYDPNTIWDIEWLPSSFSHKQNDEYFLIANGSYGAYLIKMTWNNINEKNSNPSSFIIFPTIFNSPLKILSSLPFEEKLYIYDNSGKKVWEQKVTLRKGENNLWINIPKGIYFMKLGEIQKRKIIKIE